MFEDKQRGNQKSWVEEAETVHWPKEKIKKTQHTMVDLTIHRKLTLINITFIKNDVLRKGQQFPLI